MKISVTNYLILRVLRKKVSFKRKVKETNNPNERAKIYFFKLSTA